MCLAGVFWAVQFSEAIRMLKYDNLWFVESNEREHDWLENVEKLLVSNNFGVFSFELDVYVIWGVESRLLGIAELQAFFFCDSWKNLNNLYVLRTLRRT